MNDIPIGSMVGKVRILSESEAIEALLNEDYSKPGDEAYSAEVREQSHQMMIAFIKSQNLVCGVDEIGQLLLYWHGSPAALIAQYYQSQDWG